MSAISPPRLARWLLERRLSGPTKTFFMGDLEERFVAMAHARPFRARLWYWRQCVLAMVLPMPGVMGVGDGGPALLGSDLRQAVRGIVRNPIQTALAVVPLGLGIGVVATAFSIVWGTVLAGLPFEDAHELVHFERARLAEGQE